jgi:DNA-binding NarL/FixJ family response regulator
MNLTEREKQVCNLILNGKSNKRIADDLNITESTVKGYISRIYIKFNIHSSRELFSKFKNLDTLLY